MTQSPSIDAQPQGKKSFNPFGGVGTLRETLKAEGLGLPYLGFRIFKWLLLVVFVMIVVLAFFAWLTYPDSSRYLPAAGEATPAQAQAWDAAWAAWVSSIKDLGQIFLLTPVFPLIGAVIGYIFGREKAQAPDADRTDAIARRVSDDSSAKARANAQTIDASAGTNSEQTLPRLPAMDLSGMRPERGSQDGSTNAQQ